MKILVLRLEGPLQSWGERSRWDHRDTAEFPTKSGIVGLIGCAMGIPRDSDRLRALAAELTMAVRMDRHGSVLTDFHTVQGRVGKILSAAGAGRSDTIVTPREYLEDACFSVFLTGKQELLDACMNALQAPAWIPYLGRKSCVPAMPLLPIMTDTYSSLQEAVEQYRWRVPVRSPSWPMRAEIEHADGEHERSDHPVNASRYIFGKRRVRSIAVEGGEACI